MYKAPLAVIVVPCFNEAARLDEVAFQALAAPSVQILFVNDGSTDATAARIANLTLGYRDRMLAMNLARNVGKGEAVRLGMQEAFRRDAAFVGFLDADLSTPGPEALRLLGRLQGSALEVVTGARLARAGATIERRRTRHYLGRVFATAAANILRFPFYDTQCGAKFFRSTPSLAAAIKQPFISRWAFDIELLGRLAIGCWGAPPVPMERFHEEPLRVWRDVAGSKVSALHALQVASDLVRISYALESLRSLKSRSISG